MPVLGNVSAVRAEILGVAAPAQEVAALVVVIASTLLALVACVRAYMSESIILRG